MILPRFFVKEITISTLMVCLVLFLIGFSTRFSFFLSAAAKGELQISFILPVILNSLPQNLSFILPLSYFIGSMTALHRLHTNNEMITLQMAGISERRILYILSIPMMIFLSISLVFNLWVTPASMHNLLSYLQEQDNLDAINKLTPGRFQQSGNLNLYYQDQKLNASGYYVVLKGDEGDQFIFSETFKVDKNQKQERVLKLENGHEFLLPHSSAATRKTLFESMELQLPEQKTDSPITRAEAQTNRTLLQSDDPEYINHFFFRIALSFIVCIFWLGCIPLSRTKPRQSRVSKLLNSLLFCMITIGSLLVVSSAAKTGSVRPEPVYLGWFFVMATTCFILFKKNILLQKT